MKHLKLTHRVAFVAILAIAVVACLAINPQPTFAATPPDGGGDIIDNPILLNATSMGTGQQGINAIQSFLSSKGGFLSSYTPYLDCSVAILSNQQTIDAYKAVGAPCNTTVTAAAMIYYSSQVYGVNPQVVLATMQKEQTIITAPTLDQYKINYAMGYGCPDSGGCSASPNSNFLWQLDEGTYTLRKNYESAQGNLSWWWPVSSYVCGTSHNYYKPSLNPGTTTTFYDDSGVAYATYKIANAATSSMYCYTPHAYNNPTGAYGNPQYGTVGSYYSGSYNFVHYFNAWFGSTYAFTYGGVNYSEVFDPVYYLANDPDVAAACDNNQICSFNHFIAHGMSEGRQASANFNVQTYRENYQDLRWVFGTNLPAYYVHYVNCGEKEGRVATGTPNFTPVTSYGGTDYASIYDYQTYMSTYADLQNIFGSKYDDTDALLHFVNSGMNEGRTASANFNVNYYRDRYPDLRAAFGSNLKAYYMHYITNGRREGRVANTDEFVGTTVLNGVDYSAVYNFNTYETTYSDIKNTFGLNDTAALQHFVTFGMKEGRQASANFNVFIYKDRYPDLQKAFGNDLPAYYMHYITNGQREGRVAI